MDGLNMCAAPLDIDPRQRYFTTVQPFSYRDTLTVLGYVQEVAEHVDELREQLDNLAKDENADVEAIKQLIAGFNEQFERINKTLDDLEKQVGQYEDSDLTYNPTRGKYEDSKNTNRDMYRELAVFVSTRWHNCPRRWPPRTRALSSPYSATKPFFTMTNRASHRATCMWMTVNPSTRYRSKISPTASWSTIS